MDSKWKQCQNEFQLKPPMIRLDLTFVERSRSSGAKPAALLSFIDFLCVPKAFGVVLVSMQPPLVECLLTDGGWRAEEARLGLCFYS